MDSDVEVARARLGRTVGGRWLLERVLGTGGMGAVYAARAADGSVAAVKILHPEMGARREVRERFLREGFAAHKIAHPGVVQMLGQGDGAEAFLAMELLQGETLRDRVRRHGRLPIDEVLDMAAQVLSVLVAAHEHGVIHRDLKPDNLFVMLDGRVKVLDFGLARLLDDVPGQQKTRTGVALGTLAYMAPEQALGRRAEIDGRADLFALGATLFRVLSGRRVHEAESDAELLMAMASRPAPPLKAIAPDVPDGVAGVVDLALAFARDARYPDARTMLADVSAVRGGAPPPFARARLTSREERTRPDVPAFAPRTQPLEAQHAPVSQRTQPMPVSQRTVPLAAYAEHAAPYGAVAPQHAAPAPYVAPQHAVAPVVPAPSSTRTEPFAEVAPPFAPVLVPAPVPRSGRKLSLRERRGLVAVLVVAGTLTVASLGGLVAYFALGARAPSDAALSTSALPAPLPSAGATASTPTDATRPSSPASAVPSPSSSANPSSDAATHGRVPRSHTRKPHG